MMRDLCMIDLCMIDVASVNRLGLRTLPPIRPKMMKNTDYKVERNREVFNFNHYGNQSKPTSIPETKTTHAKERGKNTFHPNLIS